MTMERNNTMTFEPTTHQKNILLDLQAAWAHLRECVITVEDGELRQRLLFHVDECLNWSHVRHLPLMKSTLLSIHQVAYQKKADYEVQHAIERIRVLMNELFASLNLGWRV